MELIYTEEKRGLGRKEDPIRIVKQWWTKDGKLVVEKDEWLEWKMSKNFSLRIENMQKENDRLERENRRLENSLRIAQGKIVNYENDLARYQELVGPLEMMPTTLMYFIRAAAKRFLTSGRSGYKEMDINVLISRAHRNLTQASQHLAGIRAEPAHEGWKHLLDAFNYIMMAGDNFRRNSLPSREEI